MIINRKAIVVECDLCGKQVGTFNSAKQGRLKLAEMGWSKRGTMDVCESHDDPS